MARSIMPSGDARKAASRAAFRATAGSRSSSASAQLAGVPEYSADRAAHLFGAVGEFRGRAAMPGLAGRARIEVPVYAHCFPRQAELSPAADTTPVGAGGFLFKSAARAEDVDRDSQDQRDAEEQPDVAE